MAPHRPVGSFLLLKSLGASNLLPAKAALSPPLRTPSLRPLCRPKRQAKHYDAHEDDEAGQSLSP